VVDQWEDAYSSNEITWVGYTNSDPFYSSRMSYYGITAVPTICGNGTSDVWPCNQSTMNADYAAHNELPSPLSVTLIENGIADFTARIVAEEAVTGARFVMVAVEDDTVPGYGGSQTHLPFHARAFMTAVQGDDFSLAAGASVDIRRTFTVSPGWYYQKMGVACWVQIAGGSDPSPSPSIPVLHQVLQSAFRPAWFQPAQSTFNGTELQLTWTPMWEAAQFWIYGERNEAYFSPGLAPGYAHRLATLPAGSTLWSTTTGLSNPTDNWTYLIVAVDSDGLEITRSNRLGEFEFETP
jgi:hypothetical protein